MYLARDKIMFQRALTQFLVLPSKEDCFSEITFKEVSNYVFIFKHMDWPVKCLFLKK